MNLLRAMLNFAKDVVRYVRFPHAFIAFRGVYDSFESAIKAMPKHQKKRGASYDEAKVGEIQTYLASYSKPIAMAGTEYPLFFWLDRIVNAYAKKGIVANVCDFGGGNGRHYFAYVSYADSKPLWRVCELANNVKLGREIAAGLGVENLHFIGDLSEEIKGVKPCNIFLSSGALFYLPDVYDVLRRYLTAGGGGYRAYNTHSFASAR